MDENSGWLAWQAHTFRWWIWHMGSVCQPIFGCPRQYTVGSKSPNWITKPPNEVASHWSVYYELQKTGLRGRIPKQHPWMCTHVCEQTSHWSSYRHPEVIIGLELSRSSIEGGRQHKSKTLLDTIVKNRGLSPHNNHPNNWQNISQRTSPRPFQGQLHPTFNSNRNTPVNSLNAPRSFNNTAVPMDLSWTQGNRGQGRRQFRNNATQNSPSTGNCFNCNQPRHFAQNCPQKKSIRTTLEMGKPWDQGTQAS